MTDHIRPRGLLKWLRSVPVSARIFALSVIVLGVAAFLATKTLLHGVEEIEAVDASYTSAAMGACPLGSRDGTSGRHELRSANGVPFTVITPRNFRSGVTHPLLVVFAPAGFGPGLSERYAGLTAEATRAGFVVTYVGSIQMSLVTMDRFAGVVHEVEEHWCIDPARVYASGHSDGGTVATALSVLPRFNRLLRGIAVSGAGWEKADFDSASCVSPLPVLIMHGANDGHFPGFGRDAAAYWSACNRCKDSRKPQMQSNRICYTFMDCAAETIYCEPERSHWRWAGDPPEIIGFLARQAKAGALPRRVRRGSVTASR